MTVVLTDVSKEYHTRSGATQILDRVNFRLNPGEHVGILGQNGSGKSTMIRVLSGIEQPTKGSVRRDMTVSWPLAFSGAFLNALTGLDNIRFICRLYGVNPESVLPYVEEFAELGRYLAEPVRSYSSGMRARLAFATSLAIDFDCYLIDEIVAVGDDRFARKCEEELFGRRGDRAMLIVSHSPNYIREHCHRASVLSAGRITNFDDVEAAFEYYSTHELAMQPHMIASSAKAGEALAPLHFDEAFLEEMNAEWVEQDREGFDAYLAKINFDRALTFDTCDAVGRLDRSGHYGTATDLASYLTRRYPKEALYLVTLGDLLAKQRQHLPAVKAYKSALDIDADNFWANRNLATEYYNTGFYAEALPYFTKASSLCDPETALPLEMRVVDCVTWLDRPVDEAITQTKALQLQPVTIESATFDVIDDGSVARIAVSGLVRSEIDLAALRATVVIDDKTTPLAPTLASGSLRRYAAASGCKAFSFHLYAPLNPTGNAVDIKVAVGGLEIAAANAVLRIVPWAVGDAPLLEEARRADAAHHAEASSLLYGRLAFEGDERDIVRFAENLISLGYYHEAEFWLSRSRAAIDRDHGEESAAVLDLLCVEIARARAPGWREDITRLLSENLELKKYPSLEANLGHAEVAAGNLDLAVKHYDIAADRAGHAPMIHFARGVHSARFANDVAWEAVDVPATSSPVGSKPRIVHLFACDGVYFERYGEAVARSSFDAARDQDGVIVHAHIVDPRSETLELAERLARQFPLVVTTEESPPHISDLAVRRAYYTCARFLVAPTLLEKYGCPILITETDALMNWSWSDFLDYIDEYEPDVGHVHSALWNWVPWIKIPAGLMFYAPTQIGREWASFVARYIAFVFERQGDVGIDVWTVDQVALWLAYVKAPEARRSVHLPMPSILTLATGDKTNVLTP